MLAPVQPDGEHVYLIRVSIVCHACRLAQRTMQRGFSLFREIAIRLQAVVLIRRMKFAASPSNSLRSFSIALQPNAGRPEARAIRLPEFQPGQGALEMRLLSVTAIGALAAFAPAAFGDAVTFS